MRRHSTLTLSLAVASTLALAATTAWARGPHGAMGAHDGFAAGMGMGMGMGFGFGPRIMHELNLSQDQQKQVEELRTKLHNEIAPLRTQLQAKQAEVVKLWTVDQPDRSAILSKLSEIDTLHEQVRNARVDFGLAVHKLLTPEQRAKAASLLSEPLQGQGRHQGCGGGDCGGGPWSGGAW